MGQDSNEKESENRHLVEEIEEDKDSSGPAAKYRNESIDRQSVNEEEEKKGNSLGSLESEDSLD